MSFIIKILSDIMKVNICIINGQYVTVLLNYKKTFRCIYYQMNESYGHICPIFWTINSKNDFQLYRHFIT